MMLGRPRRDDPAGASRPDVFVANSTHVAARIRKYYRREATVVHPPVDVERHLYRPRQADDYYLVLGRVVPYKGRAGGYACATLGRRGEGRRRGPRPRRGARAAAGPGAEFLGYVDDVEIDFAVGARALLFPGEEDFGIVPVEAQAAGVPVVAYGAGGVRDTVIENETGVFHAEQTVTSVASAILQAESMRFDEHRLRANARRFGCALPRGDDRRPARARPGGGRLGERHPDLRFEPERERDSGYALGVLRRRWLVVVAAVVPA